MHSITVKNLNLFYGSNQALFDVNCSLSGGEVIVLLGSSGAGKSTFIRCLNLLETPKSGTLSIAGEEFDFNKGFTESQAQTLRRKVPMVFQNYNLWPHKTVLANLTYVPVTLKLLDISQAEKKAMSLLERLGIAEHASKYPLQLSGGQQQRVAICRALMMEPEVILFDEPTAALDPSMTGQVAQIINEFKGTGLTQVIVTHDVNFAKKIADYVVYFDKGRITEQGPAPQVFNNPTSPEFIKYLASTHGHAGDSQSTAGSIVDGTETSV